MCSGSIPLLSENTVITGNTCGNHLEVINICGGVTVNGSGSAIFGVPIRPGHDAIHFQVDTGAFTPAMVLQPPGGDCGFDRCIFADEAPHEVADQLATDMPPGTYYLFVGDIEHEIPGCGDFTLSVTGGFGKLTQMINFTSSSPTNAQTGGSYVVTAAASSGLPVFLDIDSIASDSFCAMTGHSTGSVVQFSHPGKCIIRATQPGDEDYAAAPQVVQSFDVSVGPPAQVEFDQNPPNGIAGVPLSSTVEVDEFDAFRNLESGDNVSTISLIANGPGHLRGEPVTMSLTKGIALFSADLILDTAGTYTLTASSNASGARSVRSAEFSIMPSTAGAMLNFEASVPSTIKQGQTLGSVVVTETDQFGNRMASDSSTMVSLRAVSCAGLSLGTAPLTAGQVSFNTVQVFHSVSDDTTLKAESSAMSGPVSATAHFAVTANPDFIFFSGEESCEP
jgi:hypothetical protein